MLEKRLKVLSKQNMYLEKCASDGMKRQKKALEEQRKKNPIQKSNDIIIQSKFLHESQQFPIPVQSWKKGTQFYREKQKKPTQKNIHSAVNRRNKKVKLSKDEVEVVMNMRYEKAKLEIPHSKKKFEVVKIHSEPLEYSHRCIWKEYM